MSTGTFTSEPSVNLNTEPSLEALFAKYYARLVHFANQYLNNPESAEDITQEAFINYWNLRTEVSGNEQAIKSFLYTSVKNSCLNTARHLKVVDSYAEQAQVSEIEEETVIHAIIRSEVLGELYSAIESLPESCQKVSRMGFLQGMKNHEIAKELGVSINTVKTQKKRGLELLRNRLNPEVISLLLILLSSDQL